MLRTVSRSPLVFMYGGCNLVRNYSLSKHQKQLVLFGKSDAELAHWYFTLALKKYKARRMSPCNRGIYIHCIAEKMARWHRSLMKKYGKEYRFAIEQSYLHGRKTPHHTRGSVRPDLYNEKTGAVFDYKTGEAGTDKQTHFRIVRNVVKPKSGYIISYDVTKKGVEEKFRTPISAANNASLLRRNIRRSK